jgi:hypothetical protein
MAQVNVKDGGTLFVKENSNQDSEEILREQLAKAGYPGHGRVTKQKVGFEPLPPPNPRKRKAIDEPDFDVHDHPTGEPPKRRNSIKPLNANESKQSLDLSVINAEEIHCRCHSLCDENMLRCCWCEELFHAECVGYGELARHQFLMYESGARKFYCNGCRDDRAERKFQEKEEKKAKKVHRARNAAKDQVTFLAEIKGTNRNRHDAKGKGKNARKTEVLRAHPKATTSKRTDRASGKGKKKAALAVDQMDTSSPDDTNRREKEKSESHSEGMDVDD